MTHKDDTNEPANLGALAHEMNNSLAYTVTNLNLLTEEIDRLPATQRARLANLVRDALEGAERVGDTLRRMRVQSWAQPAPTPVPANATNEKTEGARILVVDDEHHILVAIRRALRGYDVTIVPDGREALHKIADGEHFDLILCDLVMAGLSGIDVYTRVKTKQPKLAPRIVFMTGGAYTPELREFLSRVDNTVLHKPFDAKTLRWMVGQKLKAVSR